MNLAEGVCAVLVFFSSSHLEVSSAQDSWNVITSLEGLTKVVSNLQKTVEQQGNILNILSAKAEQHENRLSTLVTKADQHDISLISLVTKAEQHETSLNHLQGKIEEVKNMLTNLTTEKETQINFVEHSEVNTTFVCAEGNTLPKTVQNSSATHGIVEGIIAGTDQDIQVIPFQTQEPRVISSTTTYGVAFNWKTRKVYWIEDGIGIKMADLDGSSVELLISSTSMLAGLAVDQITGNIYYGEQGSNANIQVCGNRGEKCVTISSGSYIVGQIWDIALLPSEGLMFWSSPTDKSSVTRANMDGTNATVIILESIYGLYADEVSQRLYTSNLHGKSITNHNWNGNNRNVLLNTTSYPNDIAVDRDALYYGGYGSFGVNAVTEDGSVSLFAKTTADVHHIALFGRDKVFSRSNPCHSSSCSNLCVLTRTSYTCL